MNVEFGAEPGTLILFNTIDVRLFTGMPVDGARVTVLYLDLLMSPVKLVHTSVEWDRGALLSYMCGLRNASELSGITVHDQS